MEEELQWLDEQRDALRAAVDQQIVQLHDAIKSRHRTLSEDAADAELGAGSFATLEKEVRELRIENEALKRKVVALSTTQSGQRGLETPTGRNAEAAVPPSTKFENLFIPYSEWQRLSQKYNEHRNNYNELLRTQEAARENRQEAKKIIQGWQAWITKKEVALKRREERIAEKESALRIKNESLPYGDRPSPLPSENLSTPVPSLSRNDEPDTFAQTSSKNLRNPSCGKDTALLVAGSRSSQTTTTQDDITEEIPIARVDNYDYIPEIVCERPVKRKRNSVEKAKDIHDRPPKVRIKQELGGSPRIVAAQQTLVRMETLDLDEGVQDINTPRRRRRLERMRPSQFPSFRAASLNNLREQRSNSLPREVITEPQIAEAHLDENSFPLDDIIKIEERSNSEPRCVGVTRQSFSTHRGPLEEISPNVKQNRPQRTTLPSKEKKHVKDQSGYHVHILSEDGEEPLRPRIEHERDQGRDSGSGDSSEAQRRLDTLLEGQTPDRKPLATSCPKSTVKLRSRMRPLDQATVTLVAAKSKATLPRYPVTPITSKRDHAARNDASSTSRTSRPPLRLLPTSELFASDFKPNPKTNEGLDFAFADTVRDHAARRCLPGCTKPGCCGTAFRALVEAGVQPNLPRGLFEDSGDAPFSSQEDEERLLRHYLGDAYRCDMTKDYRKEMLLRARAQLLANQHGKHRQQHERRSSPPGFWDTEFPSTQEIDKMREETRRRDQIVVEERWREAMREGGRWLFKDE